MQLLKARFTLFVLTLPAFLTGCGGGGRIEGTVTFDGQPVDGGTIAFIPTTGSGNVAGQITNGKYSLESPSLAPGTYKVEINWMKPTGKQIPNKSDPGTNVDEVKQVIPMEYNTQSKLSAEIKSGSNAGVNFDLKSGGAVDTRPQGSGPPKSKAVGDS
jgi:hypothetical protein